MSFPPSLPAVTRPDRQDEDWDSGLEFRVADGRYEIKNQTYPLNQRRVELGRLHPERDSEPHEILFKEDTVDRPHAVLTWNRWKKGYVLEHKSEINPTLVNGKPVKKILLAPGDRVQLGLLMLDLEERPQEVAPTKEQRRRMARMKEILGEVEREQAVNQEEKRRHDTGGG